MGVTITNTRKALVEEMKRRGETHSKLSNLQKPTSLNRIIAMVGFGTSFMFGFGAPLCIYILRKYNEGRIRWWA